MGGGAGRCGIGQVGGGGGFGLSRGLRGIFFLGLGGGGRCGVTTTTPHPQPARRNVMHAAALGPRKALAAKAADVRQSGLASERERYNVIPV